MNKLSFVEMKGIRGGGGCPLLSSCQIYPNGPLGGPGFCESGWGWDDCGGYSNGGTYAGGGGGGGNWNPPYIPPGG